MKLYPVQPEIVTNRMLDLINSGRIRVAQEQGIQYLLVPYDLPIGYLIQEGQKLTF